MRSGTPATDMGYRKLLVYQHAHSLVVAVYKVTRSFPKEELFGLVSQMRRAAVSVVANIVEGYARKTKKENVNFLHIARGSLTELEYYIDLSLELRYISQEEYQALAEVRTTVGKLLAGFIRSSTNI